MLRIDIINTALARLGESPIQSIEEGSVSANTAKMLYDGVRRSVLRDYDWNFALKEATLVRLAKNDSKFYEYAFALPSDCIRAVDLLGGVAFTVIGGKLYSNFGEAVLRYISDVEDESLFDSKFAEALTYKLASELAMPIKGSAELMQAYNNAYANLAKDAATESANESAIELDDNPYINARYR